MTDEPKTKKTRTEKNKAATAATHRVRASDSSNAAIEPAVKPESKIGKVILLLRRAGGATLHEIVEATGWQPHSARAALTGLRKNGHSLERTKRDESTCYRIVGGDRS